MTHKLTIPQYLVYCGWLIIELVFIVTSIVETRGRTLEETAALFDGEQPTHDLVQMGGEAATTGMGHTHEYAHRRSHERDRAAPSHAEYLGMRDVSVGGSSAEDLSPIEELKDRHRVCRISEHSGIGMAV